MQDDDTSRRWNGARVFATWFGCGLSPIAPGTMGSLGAVPLYLLLRGQTTPLYWGVTAVVAISGIWSANELVRQTGDQDPQSVVIDEVAGVLIALGLAGGLGVGAAATAWVLFRVLDIFKPWPIHVAERARPPGLGVMLDDLLAGLLAGLLARVIF